MAETKFMTVKVGRRTASDSSSTPHCTVIGTTKNGTSFTSSGYTMSGGGYNKLSVSFEKIFNKYCLDNLEKLSIAKKKELSDYNVIHLNSVSKKWGFSFGGMGMGTVENTVMMMGGKITSQSGKTAGSATYVITF
ncbi:MAG: hypothetical protein M0R51_10965 [Clostridia bacterium]|jgi:hypothetical protein|nr:hypothetical protein [Clostridia bacterium]